MMRNLRESFQRWRTKTLTQQCDIWSDIYQLMEVMETLSGSEVEEVSAQDSESVPRTGEQVHFTFSASVCCALKHRQP